jgi:hypothetical protein
MHRARRYRFVGVALGVGLAAFIALTACSNYGEGERCESLNNNDDCEDGLVCTPANELLKAYNQSSRCCPQDRRTASDPRCGVQETVIGGDSAPPAETGPTTDAATTDAADAAETSTDAAADGADASDAADGG